MTLKVPTLKRIDEAEYIQFKLEPLPKVLKERTTLINIKEKIHPQYFSCFESEYLNEIQSIVFEKAYKGV